MPSADPSLSLAQRIDAVCDRFEADWKAGRRQPVEAYLAEVAASEQEALRSALLAVQQELDTHSGSADSSIVQESQHTTDYTPTPETNIPNAIGRFEILTLLGEGAFGKVYKARDPQLDREVAIKVPKLEAFAGRFDLQRFLREAKSAAAVQHPNICPVHEVNAEGNQPYIVMAFIPGKSLAEYLKDRTKPLPAKQAALIVRKLALALQAAHEKGIVHRDLKPANILFDPQRKDVVITDFGLAVRTTGDVRQTQSGMLMGTPAYMSPEQARGDVKQVGPASDIFALGVILYELLTGSRPFQGSIGEVIGQIQHVDPPSIRTLNPELDERLDVICRQALAKQPQDRFPSMKDLAAALDAYLKDPPASTIPRQQPKPADTDQSIGLAQVMAALSADRRAATEAVIEAAVRRAQPPRRVFVLLALLFVGGLTALAGIIFYTRTPTATVLIHIDVDLTDQTLSFWLDGQSIAAEKLQAPMELKVGTHELLVKRGEEVIRKFTFVVSRDAGPRIELKEETPAKKHSQTDLDRWQGTWRCVAEHSRGQALTAEELKQRGTVMRIEGNRRQVERTLDGRFSQYAGSFKLNPAVSPKEFDYDDDVFKGVKNHHRGVYEFDGARLRLIYRHAQGTVPQRATWKDKGQPNVVWFEFERVDSKQSAKQTTPEDEDRKFAEWLLSIGAGRVTISVDGQPLQHIIKAKGDALPSGALQVHHFDIWGNKQVNDATVEPILKWIERRDVATEFDFYGTNTGDETVRRLTALPCVKKISVGGTRVTRACIPHLAKRPDLEELYLSSVPITDDDLAQLAGLTQLKALNIAGSQITDAGIKHLKGMRALRDLQVDATMLSGACLDDLAGLPIQLLILNKTKVRGRDALSKLSKLTELKDVRLEGLLITDDDLNGLIECRSVEKIWLRDNRITDKGLEILAQMKWLRELGLAYDNPETAITPAGVEHLRKALPNCNIVYEPAKGGLNK